MKSISTKARTQPKEKHILYGIIALLCLAPAPFGSDRPIPIAIITALTGILSIYWGMFAARDKIFVRVSLAHIKWFAGAVFLTVLWAFFQAIPINIDGISNDYWHLAQQLLPEMHIKSSISLNPHESWVGLYKILAYIMIFWLALQLCRSSNNCKKILFSLLVSGTIYALYGLMLKVTGAHKILWFEKTMYLDSLSSTFVNRNHYATYAGIVLIISLAMFINLLLEDISAKRKRDVYSLVIQSLFTKAMPTLIMVLIILASLILSNSRAGISASMLGVVFFIFFSSFTGALKKYRRILVILFIGVVGMFYLMFMTGGDIVSHRFGHFKGDADFRGMLYAATANAISDAPLSGTGLGSFADVFKAYRDASFPVDFDELTDRAHNSYLELMLELGIPAALLLIGALAIIWFRVCSAIWRRRRNAYIPAISASACVLLGAHAFVDFSAQMPAITIIFLVLLAMGLAQSWSGQEGMSDVSVEHTTTINYHKIATKASIIIGIILVIASIWQVYSHVFNKTPVIYKDNAIEKLEIADKEGVLTDAGMNLLHSAEDDLAHSLTLVPVDAYAWAYFAYIRLLSSDENAGVIKLLAASISSGIYNKELGLFRARLIPVLWDDANEDEKEMFMHQIGRVWDMDAKGTMKVMGSPFARNILQNTLRRMPDPDKKLKDFSILENDKRLQ